MFALFLARNNDLSEQTFKILVIPDTHMFQGYTHTLRIQMLFDTRSCDVLQNGDSDHMQQSTKNPSVFECRWNMPDCSRINGYENQQWEGASISDHFENWKWTGEQNKTTIQNNFEIRTILYYEQPVNVWPK